MQVAEKSTIIAVQGNYSINLNSKQENRRGDWATEDQELHPVVKLIRVPMSLDMTLNNLSQQSQAIASENFETESFIVNVKKLC